MISVFQSFHSSNHLKYLSSDCIHFDSREIESGELSQFATFEYIYEKYQSQDYWGILSWKFEAKSQVSMKDFISYAKQKLIEGYDCVFINPRLVSEALHMNPWEQGAMSYRHLAHLMAKLSTATPEFKFTKVQTHNTFSLCNYFIANRKFWHAYINKVNHILRLIENISIAEDEVRHLWNTSIGHPRDSSLSIKPFFIERTLTDFLDNGEFKCIGYQYNLNDYTNRFGIVLGKKIFECSRLKIDSSFQNWDEFRGKLFKSPAVHCLKTEDQSEFILEI